MGLTSGLLVPHGPPLSAVSVTRPSGQTLKHCISYSTFDMYLYTIKTKLNVYTNGMARLMKHLGSVNIKKTEFVCDAYK